MTVSPDNQWQCAFRLDGINVSVNIRIGIELWNYIAGQRLAFIELASALIRACVLPGNVQTKGHNFTIVDLAETISLDVVPPGYNVGIMQHSQLEWLFFFARHFCDELRP